MNEKLLKLAEEAGFYLETPNGEEHYAIPMLERFAASVLSSTAADDWFIFDDNPPPDNENILLGKHHADDLAWYWIVQGAFEEGVFHLNITDDVFKLQNEDGWHKPTHWKRSPAAPKLPITDNTELLNAAKAVIERWDSPLWKDLPHTGEAINRLRKAIEGNE